MTFEDFATVLTQEACLNSRPLIPLPETSDGLDVLTPGHFMFGRPITAGADPGFLKGGFQYINILGHAHFE